MNRNTYDQFAERYVEVFGERDETDLQGDSKVFFDLIGDVAGQHVLDAGCGEGFAARVLCARGARGATSEACALPGSCWLICARSTSRSRRWPIPP